ETEDAEWGARLGGKPHVFDEGLPAAARVEVTRSLAAVHHRQQRGSVRQAPEEGVVQAAAKVLALDRRVHVQLGELKGVGEPVIALLYGQWLGDLLAPPQP